MDANTLVHLERLAEQPGTEFAIVSRALLVELLTEVFSERRRGDTYRRRAMILKIRAQELRWTSRGWHRCYTALARKMMMEANDD